MIMFNQLCDAVRRGGASGCVWDGYICMRGGGRQIESRGSLRWIVGRASSRPRAGVEKWFLVSNYRRKRVEYAP